MIPALLLYITAASSYLSIIAAAMIVFQPLQGKRCSGDTSPFWRFFCYPVEAFFPSLDRPRSYEVCLLLCRRSAWLQLVLFSIGCGLLCYIKIYHGARAEIGDYWLPPVVNFCMYLMWAVPVILQRKYELLASVAPDGEQLEVPDGSKNLLLEGGHSAAPGGSNSRFQAFKQETPADYHSKYGESPLDTVEDSEMQLLGPSAVQDGRHARADSRSSRHGRESRVSTAGPRHEEMLRNLRNSGGAMEREILSRGGFADANVVEREL